MSVTLGVRWRRLLLMLLLTLGAGGVLQAQERAKLSDMSGCLAMQQPRSGYDSLQTTCKGNSQPCATESLLSANRMASVRVGGELNTDYIMRWRHKPDSATWQTAADWHLHNSNLRFTMEFSPDVTAYVKLDLSSRQYYLENQLLEEARVVWNNIAGGPFGIIFGKGEAPYGQDRTLGIIQSYNHSEGSYSAEGPTILNGPLEGERFDSSDALSPVYHPGEIDRVVMAGITFTWQDIIHAEFAVFQPWDVNNPTIGEGEIDNDFGLQSFAGRVWWNTPLDGLVAEFSGVREHIVSRGDNARYGSDAVEDQYAVSFGLDYNSPCLPLEIFAEYQHGWDWNFTSGYNTDTISIGALYELTDRLQLGAMAEWLRINDRGYLDNYNKLVLHSKYDFGNGIYMMAEYGCEFYNWSRASTHMLAFRSGVTF